MQTSLESPRTRTLVKPFVSAYLNPSIKPRYSAKLLVATPKPSRSLQILICEKCQSHYQSNKDIQPLNRAIYSPSFHHQIAVQLQPLLDPDFPLKHHQTR